MFVLNMCRVDYKYRLSSLNPIISKTALSNIVSTQMISEKIKLVKLVDKEKGGLFSLLKYTILIYNVSDEIVNNLFFQDKIPKGSSFVENSLTINNIKKRCINPESGFYIKKLNIKEKIHVTFKVIITKSKYPYIKNTSDIEYNYIYNIEEKPIRRLEKSNIVKTKYENNVFKQILLKNIINLSCKAKYITKIKCVPKVISTKLINCYVNEKCGVLVIGKINYFIFYRYKGRNYLIEDISGFSICMIAPIGITYLNKIDIKIDTEYICSKLVNENKIFINTSLLLYC